MKQKTIFLFVLALFLPLFLFSQTNKGDQLIGGSVSLSIQSVDDNNFVNMLINPNLGFFFLDDLAAGGSLGLSYSKSGEFYSTFSLSIGPFARYYFEMSEKAKAFVHLNLLIGTTATKYGDEKDSDMLSGMGIGPGVSFFLTPQVAIESALTYNRSRYGGDGYGDVMLNIGVQAYLSKE